MLPKGKLAGLIAIFAAIGLITATGAFTTVTAERTATVSTAGDSSALLALNAENDDYADITGGTLEINLNGDFGDSDMGSGVNLNALTEIDSVFSITNQGTQAVDVWISVNATSGNEDVVTFHAGSDTSGSSLIGQGNSVNLGTGVNQMVSMSIDTRENQNLGDDDDIITGITIHANASA